MTNPMRTAHELTRREMASAAGRVFYGTYAKCFADQLKAVYASIRFPVATGFVSVGAAKWD
jgi:hypothetical protein